MDFIFAFVVCGTLCAIAEALAHIGLKPPIILNLFLALGGILTPCGIIPALSALGRGGFLVVICGAGNAFEAGAELAAHTHCPALSGYYRFGNYRR